VGPQETCEAAARSARRDRYQRDAPRARTVAWLDVQFSGAHIQW
jgi:hypothetical protein